MALVAARVAWRGAGSKLRSGAAPTAIRRAIATVLEDRRYKEAATRLSTSISRETEQDLAVQELEALGTEKAG